MPWMEMRNNVRKVKKAVENEFSNRYQLTEDAGDKFFHSDQYGDFSVVAMGDEEPWDFLVIDYGDEDGDGFYPSDYDNFEALLSDMIAEIES